MRQHASDPVARSQAPRARQRRPGGRSARGDTEFRAFKFDVLRFEGGAIAEITTFGPALFPQFGLPPVLPGLDE